MKIANKKVFIVWFTVFLCYLFCLPAMTAWYPTGYSNPNYDYSEPDYYNESIYQTYNNENILVGQWGRYSGNNYTNAQVEVWYPEDAPGIQVRVNKETSAFNWGRTALLLSGHYPPQVPTTWPQWCYAAATRYFQINQDDGTLTDWEVRLEASTKAAGGDADLDYVILTEIDGNYMPTWGPLSSQSTTWTSLPCGRVRPFDAEWIRAYAKIYVFPLISGYLSAYTETTTTEASWYPPDFKP